MAKEVMAKVNDVRENLKVGDRCGITGLQKGETIRGASYDPENECHLDVVTKVTKNFIHTEIFGKFNLKTGKESGTAKGTKYELYSKHIININKVDKLITEWEDSDF